MTINIKSGLTQSKEAAASDRWKISDIFFFVAMFAFEDFACLVDSDATIAAGLRYTDVAVILSVALAFYVFLKTWKVPVKNRFVVLFCAFGISTVISAVQGHLLLGQPVLFGILPFRRLYATMLFSLVVVRAVQADVISKRRLLRMLYAISLIELFLFTAQAIFAGSFQFLTVETGEFRFGLVRLRVPFLLPLFCGVLSFNRYLNSENKDNLFEICHLLFSLWSVILIAFICQHRAPTIILLLSYFAALILWKGNGGVKSLAIMTAVVFLVGAMFTPQMQTAFQVISGDNVTASSENSLGIRKSGQDYYLMRLQESPLFGFGWPNSNYAPALSAAGEGYLYFAADNGIYGLAYILGAFGCVCVATLCIFALRRSWDVGKRKGYGFLQYFLFEAGNLYMGLHWFYYYPMPFMIAIALLEVEDAS